jgi:hypothetical protein
MYQSVGISSFNCRATYFPCIRVQAGRLSAQNDVSQTQAAKAAKIFAMQPENMPQVREDLQRRKLQRVLSEWLVAAKESRIEK